MALAGSGGLLGSRSRRLFVWRARHLEASTFSRCGRRGTWRQQLSLAASATQQFHTQLFHIHTQLFRTHSSLAHSSLLRTSFTQSVFHHLHATHTLAQNCHCEYYCGILLTCKNNPNTPDRNGSVRRPDKVSRSYHRHSQCQLD